MRVWRAAVFAAVPVTLVACSDNPTGAPPPPPPPRPIHIQLQSDAGDYIGAGASYDYTLANAVVTLEPNGSGFLLSMRGDQWWYGNFQMPTGQQVAAGTYPTQRSATATAAGVDWYGEGRGCNTSSGTLTIDSVHYVSGALASVDLRFVQHCESAVPALHGTIHWAAGDTTKPAGPLVPIPTSLWKPASGATPDTGTFVYLNSEAGDWVGAGQVLTLTSGIAVTADSGHLSVVVGSYEWFGDFQTMNTLTAFKTGYYGGLIRYPFNNPAKGGLAWSGQRRGCNTLTGWFAVDHVTYAGTTLTSIDLRFEQHCEGGTPALYGAIHWTKP